MSFGVKILAPAILANRGTVLIQVISGLAAYETMTCDALVKTH